MPPWATGIASRGPARETFAAGPIWRTVEIVAYLRDDFSLW